jgi:hypothetical protein
MNPLITDTEIITMNTIMTTIGNLIVTENS